MLDRRPLAPRALPRDDGAGLLHEPVGPGEERGRRRGQLASLLAALTVGVHTPPTRRARVLVDIAATADGMGSLPGGALLRFLRPTQAETTALRHRGRYAYA
jgi:hypothetical protein